VDVRRPPPAAGIGYRISARLDRAHLDKAAVAGDEARRAIEVRVRRRIIGVVRMNVLAGGVAVPDLDQGARDGYAVLVDDARAQVDQLASRALCAVAGEVAPRGREAPVRRRRAELRARLRPASGSRSARSRRRRLRVA